MGWLEELCRFMSQPGEPALTPLLSTLSREQEAGCWVPGFTKLLRRDYSPHRAAPENKRGLLLNSSSEAEDTEQGANVTRPGNTTYPERLMGQGHGD